MLPRLRRAASSRDMLVVARALHAAPKWPANRQGKCVARRAHDALEGQTPHASRLVAPRAQSEWRIIPNALHVAAPRGWLPKGTNRGRIPLGTKGLPRQFTIEHNMTQ